VAIVDPPMWYDDTCPPIAPDQPGLDFHVQPREQHLCRLVRRSGGRALLTGYGGDELLASNLLFFADSIAHGRVLPAIREMARLAATGRVSFWALAYRNALLPLLPAVAQTPLVTDESPPGSWLDRRAVRKLSGGRRSVALQMQAGSRGDKYRHAVVIGLQSLQGVVHGGILSDVLEIGHPLLHRPLVEFALRLPHQLRSRPYAQRWILREAMRGILPERVRTRIGKPETGDVLLWSFKASHARLRGLVESPILADLGLINPDRFRDAFEACFKTNATLAHQTSLFPTLALEAWLQIRSGRWPLRGHLSCNRRTGTGDSAGAFEGESPPHQLNIAVQPTPFAAG
jgi:asparagine synthase (glutamine-hydrolysing)